MSQADISMGHHVPAMEPSPFAIPAKKLAMWLFIISDVMTFAACMIAYGFLRNFTSNWPRPFHASTIVSVMVMTFILVTSSLTMVLGVRSAKAGDKAAAFRWTLITMGGGIIFAVLHLREWQDMIDKGVRMYANPWGSSLFGALYFSVTGLELLHVVAGIIALLIVGLGYRRGRYSSTDIENCGLFWQFINIVWMFVVPFVYLFNVAN